jgi:exopolysaccharide biosynthesis polyprenyl glycosylphosphotransferase
MGAVALPLPSTDVRKWLDERAARAWTGSVRDMLRALGLYAGDTLAGLAGVYTALETWSVVSAGGLRPVPNEIPLLAMVFCIQPLALRAVGAYRGGRSRTQFLRIVSGIALAALLGWVQARLFGRIPPLPDKAAYVYSAALICGYVWAARIGIDLLLALGYRRGILQRRVVVVGSADDVQAMQDRAVAHGSELRIVGRVAADEDDTSTLPRVGAGRVPLVGRVGSLREALSTARAHAVVVAAPMPLAAIEALITECLLLGAAIEVQPQALSGMAAAQVEMRRSTTGAFLHLRTLRMDLPQLAIKRTMDVILAAGALLTIAPLLALITLAIKLDSRGPVLFQQTRMGVGGRRFKILKFRTMCVDADQKKAELQHLNQYSDPRLFKIQNDPRITRIGHFLRKSSLDELPQLWNVLRGDMSLVGPRPCVPEEFEHYAPHHMERLFVVPGVTGPWQVSGRNSILDFEEVVRMDSEYIRSWSLLRDVVILIKTIPALYGKGAY